MPGPASAPTRPTPLHYLLVVLITAFAFSPVLTHDFVNWDDPHNLAANPHFHPPTWDSVLYYWQNPYKDLYIPFTYTVWAAASALAYSSTPQGGGTLYPPVFHALNLLIHLISAAAALSLISGLLAHSSRAEGPPVEPASPPPIWFALLGALFFSLHPTQVESVAWISGLKDTLAGGLSLLALLGYVTFTQSPPRKRLLPLSLATLAYVLAMLAKPSALTVPLLAAAIQFFWLNQTSPTDPPSPGTPGESRGEGPSSILHPLPSILVLAFWLLLALPVAITGKRVQPAPHDLYVPPLYLRPLVSLDALAFYTKQILLPFHLAIDYGRSPSWLLASPHRFWTWLVPAALFTLAFLLRKRLPELLLSLALFAFALLPILGLVPFDFQAYSTVTDHYLYLALLGPAFLFASLLARARNPRLAYTVASFALLLLALRTTTQTLHWRDSATLFSHTVEVNPTSLAGNVNLANILSDTGRATGNRALLEQAIARYKLALQTKPHDAVTWFNLGNQYTMLKRWPDAIHAYQSALASDPTHASAHASLGWVYHQTGDLPQARHHYARALQLNPSDPTALQGLRDLGT